jgi:hypothetical protein
VVRNRLPIKILVFEARVADGGVAEREVNCCVRVAVSAMRCDAHLHASMALRREEAGCCFNMLKVEIITVKANAGYMEERNI